MLKGKFNSFRKSHIRFSKVKISKLFLIICFSQIIDGLMIKGDLLFRGCGNSPPPGGISSGGNIMTVIFNSDSANQTAGFTATINSKPRKKAKESVTIY